MGYKVAVIGATGNVGREMLEHPRRARIPRRRGIRHRLAPVDGRRGVVRRQAAEMPATSRHFDFRGVDFALMSAGSRRLEGVEPADRRARLRRHRQFLLLALRPGRAADRAGSERRRASAGFTKKNIIANPNCSTAQLVVVLKPLHDCAKIKRVVVATYQSVSGAGKEAMDELWDQTKGIFVTDPPSSRRSSPSRSPSTSFLISTSSWKTARPRRNGR